MQQVTEGIYVFDPFVNQSVCPSVLFFLSTQLLWTAQQNFVKAWQHSQAMLEHVSLLTLSFINKWNSELSNILLLISVYMMFLMSYLCFRTTNDSSVNWLQYRILHRILPVKYYIKKINITFWELYILLWKFWNYTTRFF